jgi:hypothetical protein
VVDTTTLSHRAAGRTRGGYGFHAVARREWQKHRTVRSTWYLLAAFAAGMIGLAVLALSHENYAADRASFDPALIALMGLGIGAIIRHTAGAICALVGVVFVLPLAIFSLGSSVRDTAQKFLPDTMRNSLIAVKPVTHMLSPGLTFGLLCGYAIVALAAGAWALTRRDA